jgi:hypothetical protein
MLPENSGAPGRRTEGVSAATGNGNSVPHTADYLAGLDALAAHVDGAFVVVVKVTGDRYRRRCFLTAAAAENAARRALDRGENATVYLAELKPLYRLVVDPAVARCSMSARTLEQEVVRFALPSGRPALAVLPVIPDGAPFRVREGIARRRVAAVTGSCPCGATVRLRGRCGGHCTGRRSPARAALPSGHGDAGQGRQAVGAVTTENTTENAQPFVEHFRARVLQDALNEATASYWLRRARQFEAARPEPDEFHGEATRLQLRAKWYELTEAAEACRHRAAVSLVVQDEIAPEVWAALREAS